MKITEIAFTCYAVTDMARARAFYEGVLGLPQPTVSGDEGGNQWAEYEIGPGAFALGKAEGWNPSADGGSVGFEVENFDAAVEELRAVGVKFRLEPFQSPVCRMAIILDPDGNAVCIHKRNA